MVKPLLPTSENPLNQPAKPPELKKEGSAAKLNPPTNPSSNPYLGFDPNAGPVMSNMNYPQNLNSMPQQPFNQQQMRGMQSDMQNPMFKGGYGMPMPQNDFRMFSNMPPSFPMQGYLPNMNPGGQNMIYGQMNYTFRPGNPQPMVNMGGQNINNLMPQNGQMNMGPPMGVQMQNNANQPFTMSLQSNGYLPQMQTGMNQQNNLQLPNNLNSQANTQPQAGTPLQVKI